MTDVEFVEDLKGAWFVDELQAEKYLVEMERLAKEVTSAEEALLEALSIEQMELFKELDDAIDDYVTVVKNDMFYKGFELARLIFSKN